VHPRTTRDGHSLILRANPRIVQMSGGCYTGVDTTTGQLQARRRSFERVREPPYSVQQVAKCSADLEVRQPLRPRLSEPRDARRFRPPQSARAVPVLRCGRFRCAVAGTVWMMHRMAGGVADVLPALHARKRDGSCAHDDFTETP